MCVCAYQRAHAACLQCHEEHFPAIFYFWIIYEEVFSFFSYITMDFIFLNVLRCILSSWRETHKAARLFSQSKIGLVHTDTHIQTDTDTDTDKDTHTREAYPMPTHTYTHTHSLSLSLSLSPFLFLPPSLSLSSSLSLSRTQKHTHTHTEHNTVVMYHGTCLCCSMLQCVAVCYSVLQCVAVCCSVLQCVAVCCSVS